MQVENKLINLTKHSSEDEQQLQVIESQAHSFIAVKY